MCEIVIGCVRVEDCHRGRGMERGSRELVDPGFRLYGFQGGDLGSKKENARRRRELCRQSGLLRSRGGGTFFPRWFLQEEPKAGGSRFLK